jgi:hypothetical protein
MLLRLKQSIKVPEAALHIIVCRHFFKAHLSEDLSELSSHLQSVGTQNHWIVFITYLEVPGQAKTFLFEERGGQDCIQVHIPSTMGCLKRGEDKTGYRYTYLQQWVVWREGRTRLYTGTHTFNNGCKWPPLGTAPSALKLYSLNSCVRHVPLQDNVCGTSCDINGWTSNLSPSCYYGESRLFWSPEPMSCCRLQDFSSEVPGNSRHTMQRVLVIRMKYRLYDSMLCMIGMQWLGLCFIMRPQLWKREALTLSFNAPFLSLLNHFCRQICSRLHSFQSKLRPFP